MHRTLAAPRDGAMWQVGIVFGDAAACGAPACDLLGAQLGNQRIGVVTEALGRPGIQRMLDYFEDRCSNAQAQILAAGLLLLDLLGFRAGAAPSPLGQSAEVGVPHSARCLPGRV